MNDLEETSGGDIQSFSMVKWVQQNEKMIDLLIDQSMIVVSITWRKIYKIVCCATEFAIPFGVVLLYLGRGVQYGNAFGIGTFLSIEGKFKQKQRI